jgi:DNA-binding beta-propeller fold protein YncE
MRSICQGRVPHSGNTFSALNRPVASRRLGVTQNRALRLVAALLLSQSMATVHASQTKFEWRALDANPTDKSCKAVLFEEPRAVAVDRAGNVYVTNEKGDNALQKISADGTMVTILDRRSPELQNSKYFGLSLAIDNANRVILGVHSRGTIERLGDDGRLTVLAGQPGKLAIVNGPAKSAEFNSLAAVAVNSRGDIAVADARLIRKLSIDGSVVTVAGNARAAAKFVDGNFRDGKGAKAAFGSPNAIVFDGAGNLYVADGDGFQDEKGSDRSDPFALIRRVDLAGSVTTVAGDVTAIGVHVDGKGIEASLSIPRGITIDSAGNLFFTEDGIGQSVRKIDPTGDVTSLAYHILTYDDPLDRDGDDPRFGKLAGIAIDPQSLLYVVDMGANKIHRMDSSGYVKTLCALSGSNPAKLTHSTPASNRADSEEHA